MEYYIDYEKRPSFQGEPDKKKEKCVGGNTLSTDRDIIRTNLQEAKRRREAAYDKNKKR